MKTKFTRELLLDLLYAVENIGGNAEPEEDDGIVYSESALAMVEHLFPTEVDIRAQMANLGIPDFNPLTVSLDSALDGQITAVKLWLECVQADDPVAHAQAQIALGFDGQRTSA